MSAVNKALAATLAKMSKEEKRSLLKSLSPPCEESLQSVEVVEGQNSGRENLEQEQEQERTAASGTKQAARRARKREMKKEFSQGSQGLEEKGIHKPRKHQTQLEGSMKF